MTNASKTYSISKLAETAGVTLRTIRYYISEGLLPNPEGTSRNAVYTEEHLDLLNLIKILKDEFLPLQEIKTLLEGLDHQAIKDLLKEKQRDEPPPAPSRDSAKAYLKTLLQPAEAPSNLMRHRVEQKQQQAPPVAKRADRLPSPSQAAKANPDLGDTSNDSFPELGEAFGATQTQADPETMPGTSWQRIPLAPGVELQVKLEINDPDLKQRIGQLLQLARRLFYDLRPPETTSQEADKS